MSKLCQSGKDKLHWQDFRLKMTIRSFHIFIFAVFALSANISAQSISFSSTEGAFSIDLPAKPTTEANSDLPDSKPGGKLFNWLLTKELMGFAVSYADSIWAKKGEEYLVLNHWKVYQNMLK